MIESTNSAEMWGWIGAIAGGLIGLAGGIIGTYFSIKNTQSTRERAFMIKSAVVVWVAIVIFAVLLIALPNPYRWFLWVPYSILLPVGIVYGNRRQQAIRQQESNRV